MRSFRLQASTLCLLVVALLGAGTAGTAHADSRHISKVTTVGHEVRVLFSASTTGQALDPSGVAVQLDGRTVPARATVVSGITGKSVERSAVLLVDSSGSMGSAGIDAAKRAADAFLSRVPPDVLVGLVAFSSKTGAVVAPTVDRAQVRSAVQGLTANGSTALYDALLVALRELGPSGDRRVVLLSDGADTASAATLPAVGTQLGKAQVGLDAVAFRTSQAEVPALRELTTAGHGHFVQAQDAAGLSAAFQAAASAYTTQLLITVPVPADLAGKRVAVIVTAAAGGRTYRDETTAELPVGAASTTGLPIPPVKPPSPLLLVLGMAGLFLGLLLLGWLGAHSSSRPQRDKSRMTKVIAQYTGSPKATAPATPTALGESQLARTAVEWAGRVVQRRGMDERLALKLERAGYTLRPAEWLLIHTMAIILPASLVGLVFHSVLGGVLFGGGLGFAAPLLWLNYAASKRKNLFQDQLPDSLQLISSGLSSGYSFLQALDSVVREGTSPIASEIGRALAEARLGVPVEDALDKVADRMDSVDFRWTIMAVRVQSDVGGNLAEVLSIVSKTMRDRAQLRRHVRALSAEGRLSAYVLVGLPISIALFTFTFRNEYMHTLYTDPIGIVMSALAVVLVVVGALWMKKLVKVEV